MDSGSHLQSIVTSATQKEQEEGGGALNENPTKLWSDLFEVLFFNSTDAANKSCVLSEVKVLTPMQYKH